MSDVTSMKNIEDNYLAVRTNCFTLRPSVVSVDFKIKGEYIYVIRGGITGYESANIKKLVDSYLERNVFSTWVANGGTKNQWHRLEIPMSEIVRWLWSNRYITIKYNYGYIKEITWIKEIKKNEL